MTRRSLSKFVVMLLLAAVPTFAQSFPTYSSSIRFSASEPLEGVTWSASLAMERSGLVAAASPEGLHELWIQSPPIATSMSWRPPTSTSVSAKVVLPELDMGFLRAFARYSADKVHWSSWYNLVQSESASSVDAREYRAWISLPSVAHEKYDGLRSEWYRTNPAWSSDEHELCVWIAKNHPDYFATEIPFIGYIQVRIEGSTGPGKRARVSELVISGGTTVSGLSAIPSGERRPSADEEWFFDLSNYVRDSGESAR